MISELKNANASITVYSDHFNRRIRIDDYDGDWNPMMELITEATPTWAEKLIVKTRAAELNSFLKEGFIEEALVAKYFMGVDMHFVSRYFSVERQTSAKIREEEIIVKKIRATSFEKKDLDLSDVSFGTAEDAHELAHLYKQTFPIYPTPIRDPMYVRKTIEQGTLYCIIRDQKRIISAASAEINSKYRNAELTDCATTAQVQGKGYIKKLLVALERKLTKDGIGCLYTLARSESYAMNNAFYQLGYTYGGRMTRNCMIYSGLEDMNVWYKN